MVIRRNRVSARSGTIKLHTEVCGLCKVILGHAVVSRSLRRLFSHPAFLVVSLCAGAVTCLTSSSHDSNGTHHASQPSRFPIHQSVVVTAKMSRTALLPATLSFVLEQATYSSPSTVFSYSRKVRTTSIRSRLCWLPSLCPDQSRQSSPSLLVKKVDR